MAHKYKKNLTFQVYQMIFIDVVKNVQQFEKQNDEHNQELLQRIEVMHINTNTKKIG